MTMKAYINSLLPSLRRFSDSLDKKSILVGQPWVLIDEEGNFEKLIFKKNQELIISQNGVVTVGRWEYLSSAKSLLIDRNKNKILLNQEFVEKGILVLKYDGFSDKYFFLVNENIIPDLNIEAYLRRIFYNKYNIVLVDSNDNQKFEIVRNSANEAAGIIGQVVLQNANKISDGSFQSRTSKVKYYIQNSRIFKKSIVLVIETMDGTFLYIESFFVFDGNIKPKRGDIVRLNNQDFAMHRVSHFVPSKEVF